MLPDPDKLGKRSHLLAQLAWIFDWTSQTAMVHNRCGNSPVIASDKVVPECKKGRDLAHGVLLN